MMVWAAEGISDMDTAFLSVKQLGDGYRTGLFTPSDVVDQALALLARLDPKLNAFANPMADLVRAQARQTTADLEKGGDLGPLHGIPVAIKDLIEVAGMPTGYGSKVHAPRMADRDATLVARLRAAGAVIFGKTNLLEYAYGIAHPEVGQTNNPHDPGRTAGGSSGGSAAAVAAGIVPLAIGTDTGGSIRIPASYCGIIGLKPTYGLVPMDGVFPLSHSLDHAGPLARSVEDVAIALACLAAKPMPLIPIPGALRIGIVPKHFSHSAVGEAVSAHVLAHLKSLGAELVEVDCPCLERANEQLVTILSPEAALIHRSSLAQNAAGYARGTRSQIQRGFAVSAVDYLAAREFQTSLRYAVEALFNKVDVLAAPSVPFIAPFEDPVVAEGEDSEMLSSGFANLTGHPSISLPCGQIGRLPVGLQLTAALGQDARLLSIARSLINSTNPQPRQY
jgi:aspartyl-tRNA(Asn)/glutamyl-tRNA(Gln) amidotransferase subunit A